MACGHKICGGCALGTIRTHPCPYCKDKLTKNRLQNKNEIQNGLEKSENEVKKLLGKREDRFLENEIQDLKSSIRKVLKVEKQILEL